MPIELIRILVPGIVAVVALGYAVQGGHHLLRLASLAVSLLATSVVLRELSVETQTVERVAGAIVVAAVVAMLLEAMHWARPHGRAR